MGLLTGWPMGRERMDIQDYFAILRRSVALLVLSVVVCVSLASVSLARVHTAYISTAQAYVSGSRGAGDANGAYTDSLFVQQQVKSYVALVTSTQVMRAVSEELNLPASGDGLAHQVTADTPADTTLIDFTATASTARGAQTLLESVIKHFTAFINSVSLSGQSGTSLIRLTVDKEPSLPSVPNGPAARNRLVLGALLGALIGVAAALIRNSLDTSLHDARHAEKVLGIPVLGTIPRLRNRRGLSLSGPSDPYSLDDSYRRVRATLQALIKVRGNRIMIAGATGSEGASTTASSLALGFAEVGMHVVLVEADPERGGVSVTGDSQPTTTSSTSSTEMPPQAQVADTFRQGSLRVITTSQAASRGGYVDSTEVNYLLDSLEGSCDLVIIDVPPVLVSSVAATLATSVSGVVMVARPAGTPKETVTKALRVFRDIDVPTLGLLLNDAPRQPTWWPAAPRRRNTVTGLAGDLAPDLEDDPEVNPGTQPELGSEPSGTFATWLQR